MVEEAGKLLPHLAVLSGEHVVEGEQLQEDVSVFEREFRVAVEELWKERANQAAIAAEARERPERPVSGGGDWKVKHLL